MEAENLGCIMQINFNPISQIYEVKAFLPTPKLRTFTQEIAWQQDLFNAYPLLQDEVLDGTIVSMSIPKIHPENDHAENHESKTLLGILEDIITQIDENYEIVDEVTKFSIH